MCVCVGVCELIKKVLSWIKKWRAYCFLPLLQWIFLDDLSFCSSSTDYWFCQRIPHCHMHTIMITQQTERRVKKPVCWHPASAFLGGLAPCLVLPVALPDSPPLDAVKTHHADGFLHVLIARWILLYQARRMKPRRIGVLQGFWKPILSMENSRTLREFIS